jgi:putative peptide zinc metalloprotease protein
MNVPRSASIAPLPPARRVAFERLVQGHSPDAVAAELGWSRARVIREASAAAMAVQPDLLARLTDAERDAEIRHLLGLDRAAAANGASPPAAVNGASPPATADAASPPAAAGSSPPAGAGTPPAPAAGSSPPTGANGASPPVLSIPEQPRVHPGLLIEEGPPGEGHFVVSDAKRAIYLRLKAPQAAFLASLDGTRAVDGLAPEGLDQRLVLPLLARFTQLGLLEGTEPPAKEKRVRAGDRTRIQYTLADPDRLLDRLLPLIRLLGSPAGLIAATLACAAALIVFAVRADLAALTPGFVGNPFVIATVILATLGTVMLHELGHAGAVKFHGGHVHRLGFMLFYLAPAMFCDTSDSWRFPRRAQRAAVSLAGIGVQLVVTALVVLLLALPLPGDLNAWITLYAFINFGMCMLNAVPFVKLDGYWTLVAVSDRPNLRAEATGLVREYVRRALFGLKRPLKPMPVPWAHAVFGLACIGFAPLLVITIVLRYQGWALGLGWIGASCWLLLAVLVLLGPLNGTLRAIASARAESPRAALRGVILATAVLAALLAGLSLVKVPLSAGGDFTRTGPRTATVDLLDARAPLIAAGDRVDLDDGSFAAPRVLGAGTVERVEDGRAQIRLDRSLDTGSGHAHIRGEARPATLWFLDMYVVPPFRGF